jgi:hypothetical protein
VARSTTRSKTSKMRPLGRRSHGSLVRCGKALERVRPGTGLGRGIDIGDRVRLKSHTRRRGGSSRQLLPTKIPVYVFSRRVQPHSIQSTRCRSPSKVKCYVFTPLISRTPSKISSPTWTVIQPSSLARSSPSASTSAPNPSSPLRAPLLSHTRVLKASAPLHASRLCWPGLRAVPLYEPPVR